MVSVCPQRPFTSLRVIPPAPKGSLASGHVETVKVHRGSVVRPGEGLGTERWWGHLLDQDCGGGVQRPANARRPHPGPFRSAFKKSRLSPPTY